MNTNLLVSDALEYYDINHEKYEPFFRNVKSIKFEEATSDIDYYKIIFIDKNDNVIGKSRYENIGIYSQKGKIWTWAWSISTFAKNTINIIRKVLNYGIDIDNSKRFLKNELITSRFKISDKTQIDIHIAIASYLSKQPAIFIIKKLPFSVEKYEIVSDVDFYTEADDVYYFLFILDYKNLKI
ncbi:hypothetical protein Catovirus_2_221 [Catovirus CTV1]|uniref:Uncharacterized protein n=1 Tax=Catovirus CTV1 TaxID=1977631 RepID=A0A1V0SC41_9VIRU|nr:hypothetical protein Catovirus_2_221 [Catovirus CTV1]